MRAAIALGSNLGDRKANILAAINGIRQLADLTKNLLISRFYITAPVDCPPGSENFLNAAVELTPLLAPEDLMHALRAIECAMGRPEIRSINSPRPVDLDIIYYGDHRSSSPHLTLPHPRSTERAFVLAPLCDIAPDFIIPGQSACIRDLLAALPPDSTLRPL